MRRAAFLLATALLLGCATTIAVAWALAAWAPVSTGGPRTAGAFERWDRAWSLTRIAHFGVTIHWWGDLADNEPLATPATIAAQRPPPPAAQLVARHRQELEQIQRDGRTPHPLRLDHTLPGWGFVRAAPPPELISLGADTAFGWPAPCLWYQVVASFDGATMSTMGDQFAGGILLRGAPDSRGAGFRALPLRPVWGGLVVNVLFYTALWMVALAAPSMVRRQLCRRRGLCIRCGYDLQGQVAGGCPECGAGRST